MARKLEQPKWAPDSYPTLKGWALPNKEGKTGPDELIVARGHTQEQLDEWFGAKTKKAKKVVKEETKKDAVLLTEAPIGHKALDDMTEEEREALQETTKTSGETLTE